MFETGFSRSLGLPIVFLVDPTSFSQSQLEAYFEFIGVDPAFTPDMTYRPNISGVPTHKLAQGARMEPHLLTRIVGSLLPPQARD